jgi:hypothetical protein
VSVRALADAIRALAPASPQKFDGWAPTGAPLPRLVMNQEVPDVDSRSEASTPHGLVGRVLLTLVAGTETGVLILCDIVLPAFEGARPVVDGWNVSPLRQVGPVRIFADDVTVTATDARPMVGKATFEYTVTRV